MTKMTAISEDDGIDHVGLAEYDAMSKPVAEFLRSHDDVRISLARHKFTGGWFVLVSSIVGLGQISSDLSKSTTVDQMREHIELLYGRLGRANKFAGDEVRRKAATRKKVVATVSAGDWEDW